MGFPALRSTPQTPATEPAPIPDNPGIESRFYAPGAAFDPRLIVEAIFDPAEDRVIYEAAPIADDAAEDDCLFVAVGSGVSAGIVCAAALDRLKVRRFVVVVGSDEGFARAVQDEAAALAGIRRRFVIVSPLGAGALPSESQFAAAGWHIADLRGAIDSRALAKALVVARYSEQPTLVLVDSAAMATLTRRSAPQWPTISSDEAGDARAASVAFREAIRDQLAHNPRLAAVVVVDDPAWRSLEHSLGVNATTLPESHLERGLTMGVGLSHAGCRPVVVVRAARLAARPTALREMLGGRQFRGIVIVLESDRSIRARIECPAELTQRILSPGTSAAAVRQAVSQAVAAPEGTLWHVHISRVVGETAGVPAGAGPATWAPDDTVVIRRPAPVGPISADVRPEQPPEPADATAALESAARQIREYRFNPWQQKWVDEYSTVGKRNVYLWRWTGRAVEWLTLSCVAPAWRESVCDTKFLAAMFNVLLDDLIDERRDPSAMDDIVSLMGDEPDPLINRLGTYGEFASRVWSEIRSRVREYPREPEFRRLLSYDFRQLCNQVDYSGLLHRHPHLINQTEHDLYSPHGMMIACTATLDLTCSPGFCNEDLGTLREAVWHANSMARIGNLVTTWQREIGDDDFSSGVFARAVSLGRLHADELSSANRSAIETAIVEAGIEQEFAERWRTHRQRLIELAPRAKSVSLLDLLDGLERLMASEHASRGYK